MFIVPYFLKKSSTVPDFQLWTLWVFLSGGTTIWVTDEETCSEKFIIDNYLTPNGLHGKTRKMTKTTLFYELNSETNIDNFYTWTEFLKSENHLEIPNIDIFRPFVWLGDSEIGVKDDWGWYEQCDEMSLGKFGSLLNLWAGIKDLGLSES